jgi:beta-xylosidase
MNDRLELKNIRIRDPYVITDRESSSYYLFGTTDTEPWFGKGEGFLVYQSKDLKGWTCLGYAFTPGQDFWGEKNFWAPEVHRYDNAYYMLASFYAEQKCRGVQILKSESIEGPYDPITDKPVTPPDWESLDGTLYIDDEKTPWLVFSHEWTQIQDGAICCAQLSKDLKAMVTEPVVLFHASEAPWSVPDTGGVIQKEGDNYVTDGPFLFKAPDGELKLLWSSFSKTGYSIAAAISRSGQITGPWLQAEKPFYEKDGGHGMLFRTLEGDLRLAIHTPNESPEERAVFLAVEEDRELGLKCRNDRIEA